MKRKRVIHEIEIEDDGVEVGRSQNEMCDFMFEKRLVS